MKNLKSITTFLIILLSVGVFAQKKTEKFEKLQIEMFPKAKEGYKQVFIQLPIAKNEDNLKVEFFVGLEKKLDCNNYFLIGELKNKDLEGWGYNYYEVDSRGEMGGTKMACPNQKLTNKFVYLQPQIVGYNSKLPLVFYVPKDFVVKYRILKAEDGFKTAKGK